MTAVRRVLFAVMLFFSVADALDVDLPTVEHAFRHAGPQATDSLIEPSRDRGDDDGDAAVAPVAISPAVVEPALTLVVDLPGRTPPPRAVRTRPLVGRAPRSILGRAPPAA